MNTMAEFDANKAPTLDHALATRANKAFAQRLKQLREERGMSQSDVAHGLGITAQQVSKYEREANSLKASALLEIAIFFNVDVADFYAGIVQTPLASQPDADEAGSRLTTDLVRCFRRVPAPLRHHVADFVRKLVP